MSREPDTHLRWATLADSEQLLNLWDLLLPEGFEDLAWRSHAEAWFVGALEDPVAAHVPVIESDGVVVSAAVGTVELGVPNPWCPRGRTVRLSNVVTLTSHRGRGHASMLVRDVVAWARAMGADRVDLSATPEGQTIYTRAGFVLTSAPRMKLVLGSTP